jgi:hypothetical protein
MKASQEQIAEAIWEYGLSIAAKGQEKSVAQMTTTWGSSLTKQTDRSSLYSTLGMSLRMVERRSGIRLSKLPASLGLPRTAW